MKGQIVKGIGGFYYIKTEQGIIETRGRGIFRKKGVTPTVGDYVEIELLEKEGEGVLNQIAPRRNLFQRPPIANVDCVIIVFAGTNPQPNFDLIDKFLIMAESKDVEAILCVNKKDLMSSSELAELTAQYEGIYPIYCVSAETGEGIPELEKAIGGKATALAGPSGVGKSTITNRLIPEAEMETSHISRKTGRGRHTTRHVEIFDLPGGGKLYDTPGFTSFDLSEITEEDLEYCYPEIEVHIGACKFDDCHHLKEPGCAVRNAVEQGEIRESRYRSYVRNYEELKEKRRRIYG